MSDIERLTAQLATARTALEAAKRANGLKAVEEHGPPAVDAALKLHGGDGLERLVNPRGTVVPEVRPRPIS